MKLKTLGALAMAGALLLSGCSLSTGDYRDAELQRGLECIKAGGNWEVLVTDKMARGYDMVCTFTQPETTDPEGLTTSEEEWDAEHAVCEPIEDLGEWEECVNAIDSGMEWSGLGA